MLEYKCRAFLILASAILLLTNLVSSAEASRGKIASDQISMFMQGYYNGTIDGIIGPSHRHALAAKLSGKRPSSQLMELTLSNLSRRMNNHRAYSALTQKILARYVAARKVLHSTPRFLEYTQSYYNNFKNSREENKHGSFVVEFCGMPWLDGNYSDQISASIDYTASIVEASELQLQYSGAKDELFRPALELFGLELLVHELSILDENMEKKFKLHGHDHLVRTFAGNLLKLNSHSPIPIDPGGCGAGEIAINLVSQPPGAEIFLIRHFHRRLCEVLGIEPFSSRGLRDCNWQLVEQGVNTISGRWTVWSHWPNGQKRILQLTVDWRTYLDSGKIKNYTIRAK